MIIYALDTNIISYFLKGNQTVQNRFREALINRSNLIIPPIVYYEVKRGFLLNPAPTKEKIFEQLCENYSVGTLNNQCLDCGAKLYADLRSVGRIVEDADILIAAFCIVNNYTLVTANTRHFEKIDKLNMVNWTE